MLGRASTKATLRHAQLSCKAVRGQHRSAFAGVLLQYGGHARAATTQARSTGPGLPLHRATAPPMSSTFPAPGFPAEPVAWQDDGSPANARFGDVYHSRTGGITQASLVFVGGCGLPQQWRDRDVFTVLETGFGLGLNFLVTWAAWEADPQRSKILNFNSVEAYPVAAEDIVRNMRLQCNAGVAQERRDRLPALAQQLAHAWQSLVPGRNTLRFADGRVLLTVAIGQVQAMLEDIQCVADALYLDGFSPDLNPEMWSTPTLQAATRRCRQGSLLATYTTAPEVRSRLEQLGWSVQRCKGLPPKRHRLEGVLASAPR